MLVAYMLGTQKMKELATWKLLRTSFMEHYRKDILGWYGYERENMLPDKRIRVEDPQLVVRIFAALKQAGIFGETSHVELSHALIRMFRIRYSPSTLLNELKKEKKEDFKGVLELLSVLKKL